MNYNLFQLFIISKKHPFTLSVSSSYTMTSTYLEDAVWNKYIDKYGAEPSGAIKLLNFSKNKANDCMNLNFTTSNKVCKP